MGKTGRGKSGVKTGEIRREEKKKTERRKIERETVSEALCNYPAVAVHGRQDVRQRFPRTLEPRPSRGGKFMGRSVRG